MKELKSPGFQHRIFAVLLGLGILALLVSTISLVINQAVRTSGSDVSTQPAAATPLTISDFLKSYIENNEKIVPSMQAAVDRPYITFTADTMDPSKDELDGTLTVFLPPGIPGELKDNGTPVFESDYSTVKPQFAGDAIQISVLVTNTAANFEKVINLPLKDYSVGSNLGLHQYPLAIPLNGYAGSYPQDKYTTTLTLGLSFPSGFTPNIDSGATSTVHTVDGGTVANDYHFSASASTPKFNELESNSPDTFNITLTRDWYNQFFVFAVAIIPVLFALLFFHLLFVAGGPHGIGRSFEHFTEALVVSILSVLPLRVVLVPGDISGLTRVDLVLGIGLVLIVAVAAGKYAREIWIGGGAPHENLLAEVVTAREERRAEEEQDEIGAEHGETGPAPA